MHDFCCKEPKDMYYKELSDKTRYFKENEEGLEAMGDVMEKLMAKREREAIERIAKKYELKLAKAEAKAEAKAAKAEAKAMKAAEEKAKAEAKAAKAEKLAFAKKMLKNNESIEKIVLYSSLSHKEVAALAAKLSA